MKEIIKNSLLTTVIIITMMIFPNIVSAATFEDGDRIYTLEEIEIDCPSNLDFDQVDSNNNFLFSTNEDGDNYHKLNSDGKCIVLTNQELLDLYNGMSEYTLERDTNNNWSIYYKEYQGIKTTLYVQSTDTTIQEGKTYYEIYTEDSMGTVLNPTQEGLDAGTYYEEISLMFPKKSTIETGVTYYKKSGSFKVIPETDPKEENILDYLVVDDGSADKSTEILKLSEQFKNMLAYSRYFLIKSPIDNSFYILIIDRGDQYGNVYDTNGNVVFSKVKSMVMVDSLFVVNGQDGTKIYNLNKEEVYDMENVSLYDSKIDNKVSSIVGKKINDQSEKYTLYKLSYKTSTLNPATGDNIVSTIILGIISLVLLIGTTVYLKKQI